MSPVPDYIATPAEALPDLLVGLERHWQRLAAPLAHIASPGLTADRLDDLLSPAGIRLPEELRIWWQWHNGTTRSDPKALEGMITAASWVLQPLESCLRHYARWVELAEPSAAAA